MIHGDRFNGDRQASCKKWRDFHFGTTENTGIAADSFDANSDSETNLLEFATGQAPFANTRAETSVTLNGGTLEFRYARGTAAIGDGIQLIVEWSDSLQHGSWSSAGAVDSPAPDDPENPGSPEFEDRIATVPASPASRFIRLRIEKP